MTSMHRNLFMRRKSFFFHVESTRNSNYIFLVKTSDLYRQNANSRKFIEIFCWKLISFARVCFIKEILSILYGCLDFFSGYTWYQNIQRKLPNFYGDKMKPNANVGNLKKIIFYHLIASLLFDCDYRKHDNLICENFG